MSLQYSCRKAVPKLCSALVAGLLTSMAVAQQQPKVLAPHDPIAPKVKKPVPVTPVAGSIAEGPWIVDANFHATIFLKNIVVTSPVTVTPVLHLASGAQYELSPVNLEPSAIATLDINSNLDRLGIVSNATVTGWVELQYNWPWAPLCAFVRDVDVTHSLIFTFGFETPESSDLKATSKPTSQVAEGMWWKQEKNVGGFVSLANTSSHAISATVGVTDNRSVTLGTHTITVPPGGMRTLDLLEVLSSAGAEGGIRVSYVDQPDAILINGGLQDAGVGYSATIPFAPPAHPLPPMAHATKQEGIAEVGLMTGLASGALGFPAGTIFTPYSILRNASNVPILVTPTVWWMPGSGPASFQLPSFSLAPYETRTLDLRSMIGNAVLESYTGNVNLILDTKGQRGLLVAAGSVDQTNTYVFEVAARTIAPSAGKSLSYWSIANGDDTMVTLWNPADEQQNFTFRLFFAGGQYDLPIELGAKATKTLELSQVLQRAGADANGNIIPPGVQQGSAVIVGSKADNQHILVVMDAGVYNVRKATCGGSCQNCDGASSWAVALDPFQVAVGGGWNESLVAQWCDGSQYNLTSIGTWSSSNTAVATVHTGTVSGVSPGSVNITASDPSEPLCVPQCNAFAGCPAATGGGGQAPGESESVAISMQNSGAVSSDNSGITEYQIVTGGSALGKYQACLIGVQFTGAVSPSTSTGTVTLHRTINSLQCYNGSTSIDCGVGTPPVDDTSDASLLDTDPQSGGSNGKVYDLDAPGIKGSQLSNSTTRRVRVNFTEYAVDASGQQVSSNFNWFAAVSCTKNSSGITSFATDVTNDNRLGQGTTKLSWNLQ